MPWRRGHTLGVFRIMAERGSIVIHSSPEDAHGSAVHDTLVARDAPTVLLAQEECFASWAPAAVHDEVLVHVRDRTLHSRDIAAIYWRQDYSASAQQVAAATNMPLDVARFVAEQRERHAYGCWYSLERSIPFVNSLTAHRHAQSKTYQHLLARKLGLRVPDVYTGADRTQAVAFARALWASGRRCCTKNIEATRFVLDGQPHSRFTRLFEPRDLTQLETLHLCPMIFQEYIEKKWEYRVTIVGEQVFACRIDSQSPGGETAIDWRHYDIPRTPHQACSLPSELSRRLVELLRRLGLTYGAVDLVHSTGDEIFFLEVNSLGSWLWVEDLAGLPITKAIADQLVLVSSGRA